MDTDTLTEVILRLENGHFVDVVASRDHSAPLQPPSFAKKTLQIRFGGNEGSAEINEGARGQVLARYLIQDGDDQFSLYHVLWCASAGAKLDTYYTGDANVMQCVRTA